MDLVKKKCVPCEGGTAPMDETQACSLLERVPGWERQRTALVRTYTFKNFIGSMAFVNKVAEIAEAEGHHPDIQISWNKVSLTLTTHAIGGLSENDFIVAAKINELG
jgi:4a-hydroxytetrahydrobiopterin dehydratase